MFIGPPVVLIAPQCRYPNFSPYAYVLFLRDADVDTGRTRLFDKVTPYVPFRASVYSILLTLKNLKPVRLLLTL
jgi:hypothetical protein